MHMPALFFPVPHRRRTIIRISGRGAGFLLMGHVASQTVEAFLEELASGRATPGGGGAAALAASQGAALLSMVLNFTVGRKRYAAYEDILQQALARTEAGRHHTLALADQDAEVFARVMACYGMPRKSPEERQARRTALESALYEAATVPMAAMHECRTLLLDARLVGRYGNRNVLTDVMVAAQLLHAAAMSCEINILVNLRHVAETPRQQAQLADMQQTRQAVSNLLREVMAICRERLGWSS